MSEPTTLSQKQKTEIATAYIIKNGKSSIVPLYNYSDLKIVDDVLNQNKSKKGKEKQNLKKFLEKPPKKKGRKGEKSK